MFKKSLLIMLLMAFVAPFAATAQQKAATDMWDFVNSFSCSTGRQHGVVYDGEFIYTSAWDKSSTVLSMFYKYDLQGNLLDEFDYYSVDLRDYHGQDIYVAIVHFNCSNQFMLNIDDVTLYRDFDKVNENYNAQMSVYPNPATEMVKVESEESVDSYEVYNMAGALVLRRNVSAKNFGLDLRELPAGTYVLKTNANGQVRTQRLIN